MPDSLPDVPEQLDRLADEIGRYRALTESLLDQNEELRRVTLDRILEPLLRDLIKLSEDYRRRAAVLEDGGVTAGAEVCVEVAQDLDMVLERYGVVMLAPEPGTVFDRRDHRATGSAETPDQALDGTVAATRNPGYRAGERVLRYPEVVVHRHLPSSATTASASDDVEKPQEQGEETGSGGE